MQLDDLSYFRQRAERERERAKCSSCADVAEIHAELAALYDALVTHAEMRPQTPLSP